MSDVLLTDVERLRLEPGDIVIYRTDRPLRAVEAGQIQDALRAQLGADIPVVVLDEGGRLQVVNRNGLDRPAESVPLRKGPADLSFESIINFVSTVIPPADRPRFEWVAPRTVIEEVARMAGCQRLVMPTRLVGFRVVIDDKAEGLCWHLIEDDEVIC